MKTSKNQLEAKEQLENLHRWIKPGDTVYTILRHVSRSGMMRHISVVVIDKDGSTTHPNYATAKVTGLPLVRLGGFNDAVKVGGCGMDMGFHVVESLSRAMFPDGFTCIGEKCPSNDHTNGDRDYTPHHHKSGGYALRQCWL